MTHQAQVLFALDYIRIKKPFQNLLKYQILFVANSGLQTIA